MFTQKKDSMGPSRDLNVDLNRDLPILILGAGPAGSTLARIFAEAGYRVDLHEQRNHLAGNCYDSHDEFGILRHNYGPHYFRTNSDELLKWLSRFTDWIPGDYFVKAKINQQYVPLPVSLTTFEQLKWKEQIHPATVDDFKNYLSKQIIPMENPENAQEQCHSLIGKELYELLFKNYTIKQWGLHPKDLSPEVTARLPLRFNRDERYPSEKHQCLPEKGYTKMFEKILDHSNIQIKLNSSLKGREILGSKKHFKAIFYTGRIDEFFDFQYEALSYRSLKFEWIHYANENFKQSCVQYNYPNDYEFTRSIEAKHITKQQISGTTICYEYPSSTGEPFYPMPILSEQKKYELYKKLSIPLEEDLDHPLFFIGRLAEYRYYNMDHIFLKAYQLANTLVSKWN